MAWNYPLCFVRISKACKPSVGPFAILFLIPSYFFNALLTMLYVVNVEIAEFLLEALLQDLR